MEKIATIQIYHQQDGNTVKAYIFWRGTRYQSPEHEEAAAIADCENWLKARPEQYNKWHIDHIRPIKASRLEDIIDLKPAAQRDPYAATIEDRLALYGIEPYESASLEAAVMIIEHLERIMQPAFEHFAAFTEPIRCPYCNEPAKFGWIGHMASVQCTNDHCEAIIHPIEADVAKGNLEEKRAQVIAAWNRRPREAAYLARALEAERLAAQYKRDAKSLTISVERGDRAIDNLEGTLAKQVQEIEALKRELEEAQNQATAQENLAVFYKEEVKKAANQAAQGAIAGNKIVLDRKNEEIALLEDRVKVLLEKYDAVYNNFTRVLDETRRQTTQIEELNSTIDGLRGEIRTKSDRANHFENKAARYAEEITNLSQQITDLTELASTQGKNLDRMAKDIAQLNEAKFQLWKAAQDQWFRCADRYPAHGETVLISLRGTVYAGFWIHEDAGDRLEQEHLIQAWYYINDNGEAYSPIDGEPDAWKPFPAAYQDPTQ